MTPEPLACPYCNARVPAPAPGEVRARIPCPRCGETFPYRPAETAVAAGAPPPAAVSPRANGTAPAPQLLRASPAHAAVQIAVCSGLVVLASLVLRVAFPESETTRTAFPFMFLLGSVGTVAAAWLWFFRRPRSNGATALFLVGNMALVALIVLPYALLTTDFRRSHDPPPKGHPGPTGPGPDGKTPAGQAPGELAALGHLPADSNLLVGVHVGELWRDKAGQEFLEQPAWGPLEAALGQVERWTGLRKEVIDHVALGAQTRSLPFVRLTAVVRTRRAYDPRSFRVLLEKSKPMEHQGRLLYPLQLPLGHGALWCAGERTLVLALWFEPSTFEALKGSLTREPRRGSEGLRPSLRNCLEERLPRDARAWVVGESVPAEMLGVVLPFAREGKIVPAPLKQVRVFSAGLRFPAGGKEVVLSGDLECADRKSAEALQDLLESRKVPGLGAVRVVGPASRVRGQALLGATAVGLGTSGRGGEMAGAVTLLAAKRPAEQRPEARRRVRIELRADPGRFREAMRAGGRLFPGLGRR
jgi:hypothetical protein